MPQGDNHRKLSDEQRAMLIQRYLTPSPDGTWTGCTLLAREFGVRPLVVLYHLRRAGVTVRDKRAASSNGKRCKPITRVPQTTAPLCKCGCGAHVPWLQPKNRWAVYCAGHYRKAAPYKTESWLRYQYETCDHTALAIAVECGVNPTTIAKFLRKFGIRIRAQPEALALSGGARGARNPSWKGGIAKWDYAPEWKRIARRIRKRDSYTCQLCYTVLPKSSRLLHVHHIDEDKFHNADTNLVTVCASCHPRGTRRSQEVAALLAARL